LNRLPGGDETGEGEKNAKKSKSIVDLLRMSMLARRQLVNDCTKGAAEVAPKRKIYTMFFKIKDKKYWESLGTASIMGLHVVSGTVVGLAMGYYLDKWLGTKPWLLLIFLVFGIIAGFRNMFQELKKITKDDDKGASNDT
jgi:ATP synthase protein I